MILTYILAQPMLLIFFSKLEHHACVLPLSTMYSVDNKGWSTCQNKSKSSQNNDLSSYYAVCCSLFIAKTWDVEVTILLISASTSCMNTCNMQTLKMGTPLVCGLKYRSSWWGEREFIFFWMLVKLMAALLIGFRICAEETGKISITMSKPMW